MDPSSFHSGLLAVKWPRTILLLEFIQLFEIKWYVPLTSMLHIYIPEHSTCSPFSQLATCILSAALDFSMTSYSFPACWYAPCWAAGSRLWHWTTLNYKAGKNFSKWLEVKNFYNIQCYNVLPLISLCAESKNTNNYSLFTGYAIFIHIP